MTIGYSNPSYPTIRNILDKVQGVNYLRVRPYSNVIGRVLPKFLRAHYSTACLNCYIGGWGARKADLLHFFNILPLCPKGTPYITTYEDFLPRLGFPLIPNTAGGGGGQLLELSLASMASKRCKKLIALAEHIATQQRLVFADFGLSDVSQKIQVLHPPQNLLTTEDEIHQKIDRAHPLHFIFVGGSFYRKGGAALVQALVKLRKSFDVKLTCIGNLTAYQEWRADPRLDSERLIRKLLDENKSWITFYERLPNEQVLTLMKTADVGCLPTRGDTYGYSVLEMQAAGLPCVTTNLRALPEINNHEIGWLMPVPLNGRGNEDVASFEDLCALDKIILQSLERICADILSRPEQVYEKSIAAFRAVHVRNNPVQFANSLKKLYKEALNS